MKKSHYNLGKYKLKTLESLLELYNNDRDYKVVVSTKTKKECHHERLCAK